jgi:hypothetical protein
MEHYTYNGTSDSAGPTTTMTSPRWSPDRLVQVTFKELKAEHYRIVAESREARARAGRLFRITQPWINEYLPCGSTNNRTLAYEHALIISYARHVDAAIETKYGKLPALRLEDLQAFEAQAKALLARGPTTQKVAKLGAVQFAVGGILKVHYFQGIGIIPDRKRVLLKVLTLLMCFSAAIKDRQQRPATAQPEAVTSH